MTVTLAIVALFMWIQPCKGKWHQIGIYGRFLACGLHFHSHPSVSGRTFHSNDSELIDENDYFDGDEEERPSDAESQKRQHLLQRSPQQPQQPQLQPLYSSLLVPNANVQPNPLRLPNVLNLPPGAPARWVQPMGNGLPANPIVPPNPNVPAGGQRYVLMPFTTPTDTKTTPAAATSKVAAPQQPLPQSQTVRLPQSATPPAVDPTVGRPWELPPGPAPVGALPGAPLTGNVGQRLIVLPSGGKPPAAPAPTADKLPRQQPFPQPPVVVPTAERPVFPQVVTPTALPSEKPTVPLAASPAAKTTSATAAQPLQPQTPQVIRVQPTGQSELPKAQVRRSIVDSHVNCQQCGLAGPKFYTPTRHSADQ